MNEVSTQPIAQPTAQPSAYERDLDRNAANFVALTPLTYLERAAAVWPE
ncbi:hypothetical protein J2847_005595, partial [Azospirillum agricola]|nr:hypothetical protein [Azospirillum agricola]